MVSINVKEEPDT